MHAPCARRLPATWLSACALLAWTLGCPAAACARASCTSPRMGWDAGLPSRWQRSLLAACDALGTDRDVDPNVGIVASGRGAKLRLDVTADGRKTTRQVDRPEELLATVQALVLLPPAPPPPASVPRPEPPRERDALPPPTAAQRLERQRAPQVELGAVVMGRVALGPDYVSPALALHAGIRLDHLSLGLDMRWNPYQTSLTHPQAAGLEVESLGAGFFVTQRVIDAPTTALDLGGRVFLSADTLALEADETATENTTVDARLGVIARWLLGSPQSRWALELDAEVSPARLRTQGELPVFSIGLGGGGAWEVK